MKRTLLTLFLVMAACFLVITSCDDSKNIKVYTVSFDTDDGTEVPVQSVREGGKAEKPATHSRSGSLTTHHTTLMKQSPQTSH